MQMKHLCKNLYVMNIVLQKTNKPSSSLMSHSSLLLLPGSYNDHVHAVVCCCVVCTRNYTLIMYMLLCCLLHIDRLLICSTFQTINPKRGSVLLRFDPLQEAKDHNFALPGSPGECCFLSGVMSLIYCIGHTLI